MQSGLAQNMPYTYTKLSNNKKQSFFKRIGLNALTILAAAMKSNKEKQ